MISHIAELHHESKLHIYQCSKDDLRTRRALSSRDQIYSQDRLVQQTGRRAQWQSRSHFLPDRGFSTPAIHSNNCFVTGPSGNSLAASIALACSGAGRWAWRTGSHSQCMPLRTRWSPRSEGCQVRRKVRGKSDTNLREPVIPHGLYRNVTPQLDIL